MAQIKVRIELNKGRTGAPLDKLGDVARQFDRFLRSLAADLKLPPKPNGWLAVAFRNGSISWDAALQEEVTESQVNSFNQALEFVTDFDPDSESTNGLVSDASLLQFAKLGECIDPDEVIGIGVYAGGRSKLKWRRIEYRRASRIRRAIEEPIASYGSLQGLLHAVILEGVRPYFAVHELGAEKLVKCYYEQRLYDDVIGALARRNAVIHATGDMKLDRASRSIGEMEVERIDKVDSLSDEEFRSFFGMAPNLTGEMSTSDYIREYRDA
jgi:hypothetical protein